MWAYAHEFSAFKGQKRGLSSLELGSPALVMGPLPEQHMLLTIPPALKLSFNEPLEYPHLQKTVLGLLVLSGQLNTHSI